MMILLHDTVPVLRCEKNWLSLLYPNSFLMNEAGNLFFSSVCRNALTPDSLINQAATSVHKKIITFMTLLTWPQPGPSCSIPPLAAVFCCLFFAKSERKSCESEEEYYIILGWYDHRHDLDIWLWDDYHKENVCFFLWMNMSISVIKSHISHCRCIYGERMGGELIRDE